MSDELRFNSEFDGLLEKLCEQQLSDLERDRLECMLREGKVWRRRYLNYVDLHATLWLFGSDPTYLGARDANPVANVEASPADVAIQRSAKTERPTDRPTVMSFLGDMVGGAWSYFQKPVALSLIVLSFVAGGASLSWWAGRFEQSHAGQTVTHGEPQPTAVAYLTLANGCNWGGSSPRTLPIGQSLPLGDEITLHEGIAEFSLASGVSLSIEGPASVVLTSPNSLIIQYGKLTAHVPWTVRDFKAIAATCRLTASDAEFGVSLSGNSLDIHAFSGNVQAINSLVESAPLPTGFDQEPPPDDGENFRETLVSEGRSISLLLDGESLRISKEGSASPREYATKLTMAGLLPVGKQYVQAVLESQPLDYWRFESASGGQMVSETAGKTALNVVGDLRLAGSPNNRVLVCGQPGTNCFLQSAQPTDQLVGTDYSVEVWIKPSHSHRVPFISMFTLESPKSDPQFAFGFALEGPGGPGAVGMSIRFPNRMRFIHRDPPSRNHLIGHSCMSDDPYLVRRWQHAVAVKDASTMWLYIDGKVAGTVEDNSQLTGMLHMVVGQEDLNKAANHIRFIGELDELAIYNRALTREEINRHYKAVSWATDHLSISMNQGI